MAAGGSGGKFSTLLLEGLDHYRKGRMMEAVRAWEEAYLLEPTNLRAREFLRSALERIHAHMTPNTRAREEKPAVDGTPKHPWLPPVTQPPSRPVADPAAAKVAKKTKSPGPNTGPAPNPWDEGPSVAIPQKEEKNEP